MTSAVSTAVPAMPHSSAVDAGGARTRDGCGLEPRGAVRIEAHGTEPAAFVTEVGGLYRGGDWTARPTGQPFAYRYTAVGDTAVTLRRCRVSGAVRGTVPRTDDYVLQWITAGWAVPDVRVDRVPLTLGVPMLLPADRGFAFEYQDYDQRLVHLSRELVQEVAAERFHTGAATNLGLDHRHRLDPDAVVRWRDQLALLAGELRNGVGTLLWHVLTRDAAAAFLELYPPTVAAVPAPLLAPRRARLRVAVEFIHAHAHEPLSVIDIARTADLSVRSVQDGFLRNLGQPPMTYLLHVRLERVRAELRASEPGCTTVQTVAHRWGFGHMGRFSAAYRGAFGEYPRDTLRR